MKKIIDEIKINSALESSVIEDAVRVREILSKALEFKGLNLDETAQLTAIKSDELLQELFVAANKVKNIRAASVFDVESAKHCRLHNDANIIALSGDWLDDEKAIAIVKTWIETEFSNEERHARRIDMIKEHEK